MSISKQIRESYHVYLLIDPRNNKPFYIGKGFHARAYSHVTEAHKDSSKWTNPYKCRKILKILSTGRKLKYQFLFCDKEETAYKLERELIAKYKRTCDGGILTNLTEGGDFGNPTKRPVCVYDKQANYITTYPSISECARVIGLANPNKLWTLLANGSSAKHLKSLKGFMFTYEGDPAPKKYKHSQTQKVIVKYLDGKKLMFDNTTLAAKHLHIAASTLRNWCNGNSKFPSNKNYKCYYEKEETP